MAVIRTNPLGTEQARPLPNVGLSVPAANDLGSFGGREARDLQVAGANLERASDITSNMALREMEQANETWVQDQGNQFISATQNLLYTSPDAYYRKKGQDAINGAQGVTDSLIELRKEAVGRATNEAQRLRLGRMLDGQIGEATNGISRFVAAQSMEWQKTVAAGKQELLRNQAALDFNDMEKIDALVLGAEQTARVQAQQQGVAGTDAETAMVANARSNIYSTAIAQRLQNDQKRSALALYDKVKDKLDEKDNVRLASTMKSTRTDVEADDWIVKNSPSGLPPATRQYQPKIYESSAKHGVDPALSMAVLAQESRGVNGLTSKAGAQGLMQIMPGTAKDLGITNVNDADQNIDGGVRYLGQQLVKYQDQKLALMAYNWGPGNVDRWLKSGADPAKVPEETRDYVQRVQGFVAAQGVGFDKANSGGLVLAALNDPSISRETKAAVTTKLQQQSAALESTRAAQIKGLDDTLEATLQFMPVSPGTYKKGTLSNLAEGYEAAGEKSKAATARLLASMEDQILTFAQSPKSAQEETLRTIAAALAPGKAGSLLGSLNTAANKDKAEAGKTATSEFTALKTAADNGVRMDTLDGKAKAAVDLAVKAGDFTKAREIADFYDGQVRAQAAGQATPTQLATAITDMRTRIEKGEQENAPIRQLDAMRDVQQKQDAAFNKDAFAAGTSLYPEVGQPVPINWAERPDSIAATLAMRAQQARQISERREGQKVIPFTEPEISALRQKLDESPPDQQGRLMASLSMLPADQIPGVAAALAGKNDTGDPLSRSYAAALSFYADKSPEQAAIADQILRGARLTKEMGDSGKKAATTSDAWQAALQDRVGNVFLDMGAKVPATVADAIASVYTYQMARAGRQGEKTDADVLDKAISTVLGPTLEKNGQRFLPPARGMTYYEFENVLGRLTNGDVDGLRTIEGDPVTADVIRRRGVLTNVGDGLYKVRIPDPRRSGDLSEIQRPDGQAWLLDAKGLMQRSTPLPSFQPGVPMTTPMGAR